MSSMKCIFPAVSEMRLVGKMCKEDDCFFRYGIVGPLSRVPQVLKWDKYLK